MKFLLLACLESMIKFLAVWATCYPINLLSGLLATQIFLAMNHEGSGLSCYEPRRYRVSFSLGEDASPLETVPASSCFGGFRRSGDLANRLRFWGFLANLESILWIDLVCGSLSPSESGLEPFVASDFFSLGRDVGFA
ncbi:hypothetical protein Tco_0743898 [Tanacetum coccineum]